MTPAGPPDAVPGHPVWVVPLLLVIGALSLAVDLPVARACHHDHLGQSVHEILAHVEPFGQPTGMIIICLGLWLCDRRQGFRMLRVAASAVGSGLFANLLKLCVARYRPGPFLDLHADPATLVSVWDSFQGWFPLWMAGSRLQSCPSAHTAFTTGFGLALSTLFPPGQRLFALVVVLVACQRIEGASHFVSDTFWGAAAGYLFTWSLHRLWPIPRPIPPFPVPSAAPPATRPPVH